ncbi:hypothetical protein A1Q2_00684 [Trichosporon asahii var. asahii CBS 8904]|uniref:Uncharacterized protein n=1 Tax=Trichosporon asahii var. asahii (strain CBS 8904) TaxID=1220162 RepID=K1VWX4_TRIAC|nr:hypothetical protein A1Q2_00684 [Trichosporon asahii var. asahii CBS 8904]
MVPHSCVSEAVEYFAPFAGSDSEGYYTRPSCSTCQKYNRECSSATKNNKQLWRVFVNKDGVRKLRTDDMSSLASHAHPRESEKMIAKWTGSWKLDRLKKPKSVTDLMQRFTDREDKSEPGPSGGLRRGQHASENVFDPQLFTLQQQLSEATKEASEARRVAAALRNEAEQQRASATAEVTASQAECQSLRNQVSTWEAKYRSEKAKVASAVKERDEAVARRKDADSRVAAAESLAERLRKERDEAVARRKDAGSRVAAAESLAERLQKERDDAVAGPTDAASQWKSDYEKSQQEQGKLRREVDDWKEHCRALQKELGAARSKAEALERESNSLKAKAEKERQAHQSSATELEALRKRQPDTVTAQEELPEMSGHFELSTSPALPQFRTVTEVVSDLWISPDSLDTRAEKLDAYARFLADNTEPPTVEGQRCYGCSDKIVASSEEEAVEHALHCVTAQLARMYSEMSFFLLRSAQTSASHCPWMYCDFRAEDHIELRKHIARHARTSQVCLMFREDNDEVACREGFETETAALTHKEEAHGLLGHSGLQGIDEFARPCADCSDILVGRPAIEGHDCPRSNN